MRHSRGYVHMRLEFSYQNRVCIFLPSQTHCMSSASCIAWSLTVSKNVSKRSGFCVIYKSFVRRPPPPRAGFFALYETSSFVYQITEVYLSNIHHVQRRYNYSAGSKREPKLVACKLILTFVACDGHWINISLWNAARLHSCFVKSRLVYVTTDRLERKFNSSDGV